MNDQIEDKYNAEQEALRTFEAIEAERATPVWKLNNLANKLNGMWGQHPDADTCREGAEAIVALTARLVEIETEISDATPKKVTK